MFLKDFKITWGVVIGAIQAAIVVASAVTAVTVYIVRTGEVGEATQRAVAKIETIVTQLQEADGNQRERLVRIEANNAYLIDAVNRLDRTIMASFGKGMAPASPP